MGHARLANLIGALAVAVGDSLEGVAERLTGLSGAGPAALICVGTRSGRSIDDLRRSLGLSHSGTVRLVDRLEDRGWLRRDASGAGRMVALELTADGRRRMREVLERRRQVLEELLAPLSATQRRHLEGALESMLHELPESRDDAWRICRLCEHDVCRGDDCPVGTAVDAADA